MNEEDGSLSVIKVLRRIAVYFFELSNFIIDRSNGNIFCFLFNLRSKILNLNTRVVSDNGYYKLQDKNNPDFQHFFKAEKQGNMAYGKGLAARLKDLSEYQVNDTLMNAAAKNSIFLHCLPAHRGEEVTADVIDGPKSVVIREAENRLHAQKSILKWCLNS